MESRAVPVVTRTVWAQREAAGRKLRIYGELTVAQELADAPEPRPAIILSHGFGSTHRSLAAYACAFAACGYVALGIDFCGGGAGSSSDGAWEDMTIETEKEDLLAQVRLLLANPICDPSKLFLLGASQGGVVSTLAAEEEPGLFCGLILFYPAFVLHDDAVRAYPPDAPMPEYPEALSMVVGAPYIEKAWAYHPYERMHYPGPVLICQGTEDKIVPPCYAKRAQETFPDASFHMKWLRT